jgi:hypothetical protein
MDQTLEDINAHINDEPLMDKTLVIKTLLQIIAILN